MAQTSTCGEHGQKAYLRPLERLARCLVFFWVMAVVGGAPALGMDKKAVHLGAFDYPPFYWEEDGHVRGIGVALANEVFRRLDFHTKIDVYPLKRALIYAKEGRIDGIMILIKTAERSAYLDYTDPVLIVRGLIWSAADRKGGTVHFDRLEDLKPYRIGTTLGYSYGQAFDDLLKSMKVEPVASDYINYKKLMAHRIDIFPGNEIVAKGLFKRHKEFQGKFAHSDRSFIEWTLHMGIGRSSELVSMIPRLNTIIAELKKEGFIRNTVRKYTE